MLAFQSIFSCLLASFSAASWVTRSLAFILACTRSSPVGFASKEASLLSRRNIMHALALATKNQVVPPIPVATHVFLAGLELACFWLDKLYQLGPTGT